MDSLLSSLRGLQKSEEYSDLKIFCGDRVFAVHKSIICPRSEYFTKSCRWGQGDGTKNEVTLQDEDPRMIQLMIDFMYQLDYDDLLQTISPQIDDVAVQKPESPVAKAVQFFEGTRHRQESAPPPPADAPSTGSSLQRPTKDVETEVASDPWGDWGLSTKKDRRKKARKGTTEPEIIMRAQPDEEKGKELDDERLTVNAKMYSLADRFAIEDLKKLATEKFSRAAEQDWESKSFIHAADVVFESTLSSDYGLRSIVVQTLNKHREMVKNEEVQRLLQSGNGMAYSLVLVLLEQHETDPFPNWNKT